MRGTKQRKLIRKVNVCQVRSYKSCRSDMVKPRARRELFGRIEAVGHYVYFVLIHSHTLSQPSPSMKEAARDAMRFSFALSDKADAMAFA